MSAFQIKSLYLKNMARVYSAMNLYEIFFDFTKCKTKTILIAGKNGSGKSTILSHLQPFAETSLNENSDMVISNQKNIKSAVKIIIYENYEIELKITHHYILSKDQTKVTLKSYVEKLIIDSGEVIDLNPNGNVTSFKDIIKKELGVDQEILKIINIGNDMQNFINKPSTERKKYLSLFMPDLNEKFGADFKLIREKSSLLKRDIQLVGKQIDELDNEENLLSQKKYLKKQFRMLNEQVVLLDQQLNQINEQFDDISTDDFNEEEASELLNQYETLKKEFNELKIEVTKMENNDYDDLSEHFKKYTSLKDKSSVKLYYEIKNHSKLLEQLKELEETQSSIEDELKEQDSSYSYEDYEKYRDSLMTKINDINKNNKFKYTKNLDDSKLIHAEKSLFLLKRIEQRVIDFRDAFPLEIIEKIGLVNFNTVDLDLTKKYKKLAILQSTIDSTRLEITELTATLKFKKILEQRPSKCNIDTCAFIKAGLNAIDNEEKIKELQDELEELNNRYEKVFIKIETMKAANYFKSIIEFIDENKEVLKEFSLYSDLIKLKDNSLSNVFKNIDTDALHNEVLIRNDLISLNTNLDKANLKLESLKNSNSLKKSLKEKLARTVHSIDEKQNQIDETNEYINSLKSKNEKNESRLKKVSDDLSLLDNYFEVRDEFKKIKKTYNEMKDVLESYKSLSAERDEIEPLLDNSKTNLDIIEEQLYDTTSKLSTVRECQEKIKQLNEEYASVKLLYEALSPITGIPLIYIDMYLDTIKNKVNELLEISFGKDVFQINRFVLDKEFYIEIIKNNETIIKDVRTCSGGERSLSSIALAFSFIKRSLNGFSILLLDEVDGVLDNNNRSNFITILKNERTDQQVFIISHNKEFDLYESDIILLKNHGYSDTDLNNKNVIFSL